MWADESSLLKSAQPVYRLVVCNPGMRADCLSGAIIDSHFGLTYACMWNQDEACLCSVIRNTIITFGAILIVII